MTIPGRLEIANYSQKEKAITFSLSILYTGKRQQPSERSDMKEKKSNGFVDIIAQAIEEMKAQEGNNFSLATINLAELQRRTGISRAKLRRLKANGFADTPHALQGRTSRKSILDGYTAILDDLLRKGITNSSVRLERIQSVGYPGGRTTVKDYIASHRHLVPAKRQLVAPQGSRGRRFVTEPGESYQMDWGFTKVLDYDGSEYNVACFAMVCHHCGQRYIEFFPNAKQEKLFIGMIHAFVYMDIPKYVLTDNMKSVVLQRDFEGHPVWQKDYEAFMRTVGFQTKLCKPRHPFTKGKVERLVRFVKENFLVGRIFWNITDLNRAALAWCNEQNNTYHRAAAAAPQELHLSQCSSHLCLLKMEPALLFYLCPERRISFDGFVNYEGRRFGVPFSYHGATARVMRKDDMIYIYSSDLKQLTTHDVTWSKRDRFCADQYAALNQPEEFPTMPVKTEIQRLWEPESSLSFEKFNFDKEVDWDE